ncbi:MAG TPA: SIR2 family protein [Blastocatellia bacterium]|nr:SIR2 family protein [Blastocatellia bacterium]
MTRQSSFTRDEILSIPGNNTIFDSLLSALREKEAIAFVGAGASAGMYPLWGEFIELLADHTVAEGKAEPKDAARWKADTTATPQQRVSLIIRKLGEDRYHRFLKDTFGPRRGLDDKRYTFAHATLMRLPFQGYVTTNYDPALEFARMELRPGSLTTGTPTWQDDDEVYRWYTGDVFKRKDDCPILWLHGYWQRPQGIALDRTEYAAAYKPGLYRNLFNSLWGQRHLVFVGFGFNDPQFTFMVGEYLRDLEKANAPPRHVTIIGLPVGADGSLPDTEAIREQRESLEADYHVRALFYPMREGNHFALNILLESIAEAFGCAIPVPDVVSVTQVSATEPTFTERWVHETSNDDKFVGRDEEIARLDRWVRDAAVRTIGISAVGGTGKTALVGHWLKKTSGWRSRPFVGLFGWSFYQNRETSSFLRELLLWAHEILGTPKPNESTDFVNAALAVSRAYPLVIVLDGLEVLQEGPEHARYGSFLDGELREFLSGLCQREHSSLAVLTSRFVFADLERFVGTSFHQLELLGLTSNQGAGLLEELGVGGPASDREYISDSLDGHPLGLRVFAGALPDEDHEQPRRFLDYAFRPGELQEGAPLNDKLRRLLVFYEKKLPPVQTRLLSIVALFRTPVADETVLRLARGLFGRKRKEPLPDDATLATELKRLQARGILTREPIEGGHGSACHPILRSHFRALLVGAGTATARRAADLLKGKPSAGQPRSVKETEPVLLAIELLLDAEEFEAADELFRERLDNGKIFKWIPAPIEGLTSALGFVRDETRRQQCEEKLSRIRMGFYLNDVGLFATNSGQYELALRYYNAAVAIAHEMGSVYNLSRILRNQSELLSNLGRLAEACRTATEAIRLATQERDEELISEGHAFRGWPGALSGQVRPAAEDFGLASELEKKITGGVSELSSVRGIYGAELLFRSGHTALASRRTQANLRICEPYQWNADIAGCHWMLGWCALIEGRLDDAQAELRQAEQIFHRGQLLFELARVHVTAGELALARKDAAGALQRAAEALTLAAPRGMRLVHADALVLRGRARMLEGKPDSASRALDDAEEALRMARDCGYAWAERDVLFLAAEAHSALARQSANTPSASTRAREAARRARADAEALAAKLALTEEDLAAAEAKAVAWMKDWEEKTKEAKSKE